MQETASELRTIVDQLKMKGRDGFNTDLSLVKARLLQTLEKWAVFFQGMDCL